MYYKGDNMISKLEVLEARKQRLLQNGKNHEGNGVLRKIERKINKLKNLDKGE